MTRTTPATDIPPVAELLPHEGAMVFLSRVLEHRAGQTVCLLEIDEQVLFREADGSVPAWVGIEYMAQCVAAHAGLVGRANGGPPPLGLLLGSRRARFHVERFLPEQALRVSARHVWGTSPGLVSFDCALEDAGSGAALASARLNCFVPGEPGVWEGES